MGTLECNGKNVKLNVAKPKYCTGNAGSDTQAPHSIPANSRYSRFIRRLLNFGPSPQPITAYKILNFISQKFPLTNEILCKNRDIYISMKL
ncbi:hypothetical protein CEXT_650641 [Caerostris extrusa]|uniref:LAGLIDADG homing endonuclease n=1 Tax=Caerostris extrusa TaxID=172846 RepID=A0AAV4WRQ8_CAEEX|nr:hypothetical protein CEXT_650641 [Caerostris extrusa]